MKAIVLLAVSYFIFGHPTFAYNVSALQQIYATTIPVEIRRNFDEYIDIRKNCPECAQAVSDGEKFLDVYSRKFIVVDSHPNSFGGIWATIVVKDNLPRVFQLWLYEVDSNVYDLRSITELSSSFNKNALQELSDLAYSHFWM